MKIHILTALLVLQVVNGNNSIDNEEIEAKEFVVIGDHTYYFGTGSWSFYEARSECSKLGMKLASFQTEEKWTAMKDYMCQNGLENTMFWSSGKYEFGSFQWSSTGEPFTYTDWYLQEPNFPIASEACVYVVCDYLWQDEWCDDDYQQYICE